MDEMRAATDTMASMIRGAHLARMVSVAAELGLADLVADGHSMSSEEMAVATGTHAPTLFRLLRALASVGVFAEVEEHRFALTPLAECLRTDVPGSLRDLAILFSEAWNWQLWQDLPYSVRTGRAASEHVWGKGMFEFLAERPDASSRFDAAMASRHAASNAALVDGYDFSGIETVVDVGGGNGSLIAAILAAYPNMRGVLFDLPGVVAGAAGHLAEAGIAERCDIVAGSFFEAVPRGGDAYIVSNVLHDWQDDQAATILRNVRDALGAHGRLLVVNEHIIPPGNTPHPGKLGDMMMLLIGGRERTEAEWRGLFREAGFTLTRLVPLPSLVGAGVLEGAPFSG
jgi:hypothetical protein